MSMNESLKEISCFLIFRELIIRKKKENKAGAIHQRKVSHLVGNQELGLGGKMFFEFSY